MTNHYKILNVNFGASENEIKKQFRKLATIYHPDKNSGSKKSEETFKIIVNSYETLSNKKRRKIYDLSYKQHFQQPKTQTANQKNTNHQQPKQPPPRNKEYQKTEKKKTKGNFIFWAIVILLAILYLYNTTKTTTTGNTKADKQLEEQKPENRPQSGELDFNK